MLFHSSIRNETARTLGATLLVLMTIVLTMLLLRVIRLAAQGNVSPQDVAQVLAYFALAQSPALLALSLYIAVVIVLGRMYRASEMAIWSSSGVALRQLLWPLAHVGVPAVALVAALTFFIWPWANARISDLRTQFEQRTDLLRVSPGAFQTSGDGQRVFFIERSADRQTDIGRNVFFIDKRGARESVTTAHSGRLVRQGERTVLELQSGSRSEVDTGSGRASRVGFERFAMEVDLSPQRLAERRPPKATATAELMAQATPLALGEIAWRAGLVLAAANFVLLALSGTAVNPRRANNWNLLFALLTFVTYFNLVNLSASWVSSGKLSLSWALLALHGSVFLLGLALLAWRDSAWTRWRGWPLSSAASSGASA